MSKRNLHFEEKGALGCSFCLPVVPETAMRFLYSLSSLASALTSIFPSLKRFVGVRIRAVVSAHGWFRCLRPFRLPTSMMSDIDLKCGLNAGAGCFSFTLGLCFSTPRAGGADVRVCFDTPLSPWIEVFSVPRGYEGG